MTKEDEAFIFRLLDEYSRRHYKWFVTELFLDPKQPEYLVCFRPVQGGKESPNRYECVYLAISTPEAESGVRHGALSEALIRDMDDKLQPLGRLT